MTRLLSCSFMAALILPLVVTGAPAASGLPAPAVEPPRTVGMASAPVTAAAPTVPVAAVNANLRAGPGLNYRIVGSVTRGTRLSVSACRFGWCRLTNGYYIAAWLVRWAPVTSASQPAPNVQTPLKTPATPELPAPTAPGEIVEDTPTTMPTPTVIVIQKGRAAANANLRAGPGMGYRVVTWALKGDPLEVVETNRYGTWSRLANGLWIATRLVQFEPAPTAPPRP